jgi:hypothetical protein
MEGRREGGEREERQSMSELDALAVELGLGFRV